MKKIITTLILIYFASFSYAKQILCTEPPKWFDDPEIKYDLNDYDGSFKLVEQTVRYLSPEQEPEISIHILANNMSCNFVNNAGYCTNEPISKNYNLMYQYIWIRPEFEQIVENMEQTSVINKPTKVHFAYQLGLKTGHKYFDAKNCETIS